MNNIFKLVLLFVLMVTSLCGATNLVVNDSFETTEPTSGGQPVIYGDWRGDYSSIVGATSGISPLGGSQMLQFLGTSHNDGGNTDTSEIHQIINITSFEGLVSTGSAVASASAYFNRVTGDVQTDTWMYVSIFAYQGNPDSFPTQWENNTHLTRADVGFYSDSDLLTWEQATCHLILPTNTDFIVVGLNVAENVYNDYSNEFDGHFADMASVEIVPEPSTVLLMIFGSVFIRKSCSSYHKMRNS
jgi:hypothetical protein